MSPPLRPAHVRLPQAKLSRIENLRAAPRNARTHSKKQLRQLARSITTFGFTNPVLVDASGEVIAGHGRLAAARMLGLSEVPTLCLDWLTEHQKRIAASIGHVCRAFWYKPALDDRRDQPRHADA